MSVERHFVTINGHWGPREVHYRRCGLGPAVLLLHQSPQSSAEYESLMESWAADFTVIAPDHPGYGLSDPLGPADASLEDFADGVAELLDVLQIEKVAAYGFHTGAGMAVALASRHPQKVSAVYANGYVVLDDAEREHMLSGYLPPFIPSWDGSHLTWIWTRNRDQLIFFPWFDRRLTARMNYTLPPPEVFQQWLLEFLRAGDNYRVAYRAAFEFRGEVPLRDLGVPAIITSTNTDVLRGYLAGIKETPANVAVRIGGTQDENLAEARQFFVEQPGGNVPQVPATEPVAGKIGSRVVAYAHGQLRVRLNLEGAGLPVLLVHGAARSTANLKMLMLAMCEKRPVIALDLPGHGESDSWPADTAFIDAAELAIVAVLDELGLPQVDAWGEWGGGSLLCEFARRQPARIAHLAISGAQVFDAAERDDLLQHYAPEIKPVWHGGHLLECWHRVRNESLFWPWYRQEQISIIRAEPRLNAEDLHARVLALLQSAPDQSRVFHELFAYPLANSLDDLTVDVLLTAASWDPNLSQTQAAAANMSADRFTLLPDNQADWPEALLEFFDRDASA